MTEPSTTAPLGASRVGEQAWSFLVWAPHCEHLVVEIEAASGGRAEPMSRLASGYHGVVVDRLAEPPRYRFRLPDGATLADPASRRQPDGVFGVSQAVDPASFGWTDRGFAPPRRRDLVIYELHIGTFSAPGTFDGAIDHLDELVDLGVTAVEPMPVNAFPGRRNWGYDGAFPYAVQESYGGPAGFHRFVDACHARGLAVIVDVVYNHLGPEGTVLAAFAPYFTDTYATPWGAAVNVSEAGSDQVRRYFIDNALMWVRDYHVDGLRFDAVHGIVDPTASPFLAELTAAVDDLALQLGRPVHTIAESADNNPQVVTGREAGGLGFAAQWNDDFHHALHALLTGERDGYYADFGRLDQLARAINDGFVFQGDYSSYRERRHGAPSRHLRPDRLVVFAQNHDQVGNRAGAERLATLVGPAKARLAAAVLLLSPFVPLLFMGEEYAESAPFPYFVDHNDPGLLDAVRKGRAAEFGREADALDPAAVTTFETARLDRASQGSDNAAMRLAYRELLAARRRHPIITDPEALETMATVRASSLTLHRRSRDGAALAAFNVGPDPVEVRLPEPADRWEAAVAHAAEARHGEIRLDGFGYALLVGPGESR